VEPEKQIPERWFGFLSQIPWKRLLFWAGFVGILALLHDVFDIVFLTFVLSYIFGNACTFIGRLFDPDESPTLHHARVIGFYGLVAGLAAVAISITYPHFLDEGKTMVKRVGDVCMWVPAEEEGSALPRESAPGAPTTSVEGPLFASEGQTLGKWPKERVEKLLWRLLGQEEFDRFRESPVYTATLGITQNLLNAVMPQLTLRIGRVVEDFLRYVIIFFLALVLSLMLSLEQPRWRGIFAGLEETRAGPFYLEIKPSVLAFVHILGKAFAAQALLAVVNTVLIALGLAILGVPNTFVLCGIVFVCSFIPVLGVIISIVPIALSALKGGGGLLVLYTLLWIAGVQILKAYFIVPRLVGGFLRVHPLVALPILLAAENLFGLWGLILGVPVSYYLYHHWVLGDDEAIARLPVGPFGRRDGTETAGAGA
jgi:predicted PurR-regulated permease PerM